MEMETMIKETVAKAATKANKVIISSIVCRDDNEMIKMKAEVVNANLKYAFLNDPKVIVCDNGNLRDKKFRGNDGIHLTPHGTSVFANNLKFKIAESLKISVVRKDRRNYRTENRNDRIGVYHNRSQYYNERRFDD